MAGDFRGGIAALTRSEPTARETPAPKPEPARSQSSLHLPAEFWSARPVLEQVRAAARARMVAPDAVLGALLTRVAAITPHTVDLPGIVGSALGLTTFVALVGPPEAGKSASASVAAELLPAPSIVLDRAPVPSGEGMAEVLFELQTEEDENGKPMKVKRQTRYGAIFHIDEIATLTAVGGRSGSTLLPTMRTAWTHGKLGNTNASLERRRELDGRLYVFGFTVGIQPELASGLLADSGAGTPQRFIWLRATDPEADGSGQWPGPLKWQPPTAGELRNIEVDRSGWRRHELRVAPSIRAEVRSDRLNALRGEVREVKEAHRMLGRLKIAALLALLDGRLSIEAEDWHLSRMVTDTSRAVRYSVEHAVEMVERRRNTARADQQVDRDLHVEGRKRSRALESASKSAARTVRKDAARDEHGGEGCTRRCIDRAVAGEHKKLLSVDDVIAEAERHGWITSAGGRWLPGKKSVDE